MSTVATYEMLSLSEKTDELLQEDAERKVARIQLRRLFDLGAFGAGVHHAPKAGTSISDEHDKTEPGYDGHEELYVVLEGRATITVDGDELDAPAGTVVFVREPGARRAVVAAEDGTSVLAVGGRRGKAYRPTPGEATAEFWPNYRAGDYEAAEAVLREALEEYPGEPLIVYNLACLASLTGRTDEALEGLREAIAAGPKLVENARDDSDFDAVRDDPRFAKLVA